MAKNTSNLMPPWKPGQSGNPAGRPTGESLIRLSRRFYSALDESVNDEYIKMLAEKLKTEAMDGDVQARRLLLERLAAPPANMDLVEEIREIKAELARRKARDEEHDGGNAGNPPVDG